MADPRTSARHAPARRDPLPWIVGGGIALVALVVGCVAWSSLRQRPVPQTWFYDLNTQTLFAAPPGSLPPIAAPSGDLRDAPPGTPAGVAVLGTGSPPDIRCLRSMTPEAHAAAVALLALEPAEQSSAEGRRLQQAMQRGDLLRAVDGGPWLPAMSPGGMKLMTAAIATKEHP